MKELLEQIKDSAQIEKIRRLAECDYLTGLANRRALADHYMSLKKDQVFHVMFIDIDDFKRVNESYGHSMGDRLLVHVSRLITKNTTGFVSRIGGDEFLILLDGSMQQREVEKMAKDILSGLGKMEFRKDILYLISLSIGIVLDQKAESPLDDILNKCDAAMYQAKYEGKNRYVLYHEFDKIVEINRNIEQEMECALERGEFKVYLQPKVNMVSSKLYGAEALSRWEHPIDGLRSPMMYIPLFEKNGFISRLDMHMYEEVCKLKASWVGRTYEHIPVSINMSRLHLYNKNFPDEVYAITQKYGIPASEIDLEITENVFVKDSTELINMVELLKAKGFQVSIDDFGSGFSALNLLKDLKVDIIKIDKEFLRGCTNNSRGRTVIKNVISMCLDLKLDVITEGIETKEQVDFITRCGCQIAQGYYYAKPLPVSEFEAFADDCMIHTLNNYSFRLDGDLKSEDGSLEAIISGEGLEYQQGIYEDTKSIYFPGGPTEQNTVHIPPETIVNDSFSISMWIKPKELHEWAAAIYVKFESGFCSIVPLAWEGASTFRIRDSKEVNGWYDVSGHCLRENLWSHFFVTYNAKTETAVAFINGEMVGELEHVATNRYVKWIILGGDVFQPSFIGNICEVQIYNEAKEHQFVKELYQNYTQRDKFIGFVEG